MPPLKDMREQDMKIPGGRIFQAGGTASAKALRQEHTWGICGIVTRPVCSEAQNEYRQVEEKDR